MACYVGSEFAPFEYDLSDGVLGCVRECKVRSVCAGVLEERAGLIVKTKRGCAGFIRDDFNVLPLEAAAPTCAQSLERRFFCGETRGIMLRGGCAATVAVSALSFGEYAHDKTRRALAGDAHAPDFNDVNADGNDHRNGCTRPRRLSLARAR